MEMTQEWIRNYNQKCARFLGSELKNDGQFDYWTYDHLGFDPMKIRGSSWVSGNFEFHSDWNWIMEVVDKIHVIPHKEDWFSLIEFNAKKNQVISRLGLGSKGKEEILQSIDQFIDWYNKQKEETRVVDLNQINRQRIYEKILNRKME